MTEGDKFDKLCDCGAELALGGLECLEDDELKFLVKCLKAEQNRRADQWLRSQ